MKEGEVLIGLQGKRRACEREKSVREGGSVRVTSNYGIQSVLPIF